MKKIIFSILFSITMLVVNGQGNLQFNQIITGSGSLGPYSSSPTLTVPLNKVYKIEAIDVASGYNAMTRNINGSIIATQYCTFPFWLKSGDFFFLQNIDGFTRAYQYSIIEFNIIP